MTNSDFIDILIKHARAYRPGSGESIKRNSHMFNCLTQEIDQDLVDAAIVDFVNYVGQHQCCLDVALYASDIQGDE